MGNNKPALFFLRDLSGILTQQMRPLGFWNRGADGHIDGLPGSPTMAHYSALSFSMNSGRDGPPCSKDVLLVFFFFLEDTGNSITSILSPEVDIHKRGDGEGMCQNQASWFDSDFQSGPAASKCWVLRL